MTTMTSHYRKTGATIEANLRRNQVGTGILQLVNTYADVPSMFTHVELYLEYLLIMRRHEHQSLHHQLLSILLRIPTGH